MTELIRQLSEDMAKAINHVSAHNAPKCDCINVCPQTTDVSELDDDFDMNKYFIEDNAFNINVVIIKSEAELRSCFGVLHGDIYVLLSEAQNWYETANLMYTPNPKDYNAEIDVRVIQTLENLIPDIDPEKQHRRELNKLTSDVIRRILDCNADECVYGKFEEWVSMAEQNFISIEGVMYFFNQILTVINEHVDQLDHDTRLKLAETVAKIYDRVARSFYDITRLN